MEIFVLVNVLILTGVFLCNASLVSKFTRFSPPCTMEYHVYYKATYDSIVKCAIACSNNPFGTCSRLIWNPNEKLCFLHSVTSFPGSSSDPVSITGSLTPYVLSVKGCSDAGYDYDLETNTCLKYYKSTSGGITWKNARTFCQQDGGDLISIQNNAKWNFIVSYIGCTFTFWIGLKNKQWMTGEPYVNLFGVGDQLNNLDGEYAGDSEKHCGVIYVNGIFTGGSPIQDESCNERMKTSYLCEILM